MINAERWMEAFVHLAAPAQSLGGGRSGGGGGGEALFLVSWWKPFLVLIPLLGWAWLISTVYDKDAARWYFKRRQWNLAHLCAGALAVGVALFAPTFWIGWPAMLVILGADLGIYLLLRNKDDRVPEAHRWTLDFEEMRKRKEQRKAATLQRQVTLSFRGPAGLVQAPARETPEYEIRVAAEKVIIDALDARASRVDVGPSPDGSSYMVLFTVDGVRQTGEAMTPQTAVSVIDFFKVAGGLDVSDRRRRLKADIAVEQGNARRKLRIATSGSTGGLRLSVVLDPESQVRLTVGELGLLEGQKKELDAIIQERQGAVLVCAPPQNGRTATLYALIRAHDAYTSNVQTLETEPQDQIEGVRHNLFDPAKDGSEYSTTLRSILRRDPDVVAVAELPDPSTAVEVSKADHERTRTYVGLRAENALVAVQTFVKAVGDPKAAADALRGVIAVRLVRKLCLNCRVEYPAPPELLKKLGVPADKPQRLFKKGGQVLIKSKPEICPVCKGSGYFGQEGAFEVFKLGPEEQKLIASSDLAGLRSALRRKRLPSIQEAAVLKAMQGTTSVEEVARVTATAAPAPAPQPKPAGSTA